MLNIGPYFYCDDTLMPAAPVVMEVGCFSLDCARVILARWPKARYICVEPAAPNYATLLGTLALNPDIEVEPYRAALAETDGPIPFYLYDHEQLHSAFPRHVNEGMKLCGQETVTGLTLRSLLDRCEVKTCDLLLINAEGAEIHALEALSADASLRARVAQVCTSFHCDHVHIYPPQCRDDALRILAEWYAIDKREPVPNIPYWLFTRKP